MIHVITKNGKQISLAINATRTQVIASAGSISFGATRTATGFSTGMIAADIGGGKRAHIDAVLDGGNLAKANALFDELDASINAMVAEQDKYLAHHAKIIRAMAE